MKSMKILYASTMAGAAIAAYLTFSTRGSRRSSLPRTPMRLPASWPAIRDPKQAYG
jgi:hypothetical protein